MSGSVNRRISVPRFEQGLALRANQARVFNGFRTITEMSTAEINSMRARKAPNTRKANHVNAVFRYMTGDADKLGPVAREVGPFNISGIKREDHEVLGQLLNATILHFEDPDNRRKDRLFTTGFWIDPTGLTYKANMPTDMIKPGTEFGYFRLPHIRHDHAEEKLLAGLSPEEMVAHQRVEALLGNAGYVGLAHILGKH